MTTTTTIQTTSSSHPAAERLFPPPHPCLRSCSKTRANAKSFIRRRRRKKNNNSRVLASSSSNEETTLMTTIQTGEGDEESNTRISSTLSSSASFTTSANKTSLTPRTCSEYAIEARNVLIYLLENRSAKRSVSTAKSASGTPASERIRRRPNRWLGLRPSERWSSGMSERLAKTKIVVGTCWRVRVSIFGIVG